MEFNNITEILERNAREFGSDVALVEINPQELEKKNTTWREYSLIEASRDDAFRSDITWGEFDDHVAFLERGFKAIDLIDFEYGPGNSYWHTPDDTMDHVSEASLLRAGRLVTELLNILL